ncbi:hypothetical protein [Micromonospora profundi]|uniref:hypothetical protein n=1 Tax=Micromonospora profundi TaxID=1420889 RepID=UPI00381B076F
MSEPLTSVRLYFTEKAPANAFFTITAPGGVRVDNGWSYGEPKPLDTTRRHPPRRTVRRIHEEESADANRDDIPDVYQRDAGNRAETD